VGSRCKLGKDIVGNVLVEFDGGAALVDEALLGSLSGWAMLVAVSATTILCRLVREYSFDTLRGVKWGKERSHMLSNGSTTWSASTASNPLLLINNFTGISTVPYQTFSIRSSPFLTKNLP
jgi:hypothetical protein